MDEVALLSLARKIAARDPRRLRALPPATTLSFTTGATRARSKPFFLEEIGHYVYAGDTLLHVAAAAYDVAAAKMLVESGADPRARNRRGAEPLHYACDGAPGSKTWDPKAQALTVMLLIEGGADPDALDDDGVGPLHRAVRTRSTGAVIALLACGADPTSKSGRGSTPMELATKTTGRGGAGSAEARKEQAAIVRLLRGEEPG